MIQIDKDKLRNQVAGGRVEPVLEELLPLSKYLKTEQRDQVIQLSSRYSSYQDKLRRGILTADEELRQNNIINSDLLAIIDDLPAEVNPEIVIDDDKEVGIKKSYLMGAAAIVLAIIAFLTIPNIVGDKTNAKGPKSDTLSTATNSLSSQTLNIKIISAADESPIAGAKLSSEQLNFVGKESDENGNVSLNRKAEDPEDLNIKISKAGFVTGTFDISFKEESRLLRLEKASVSLAPGKKTFSVISDAGEDFINAIEANLNMRYNSNGRYKIDFTYDKSLIVEDELMNDGSYRFKGATAYLIIRINDQKCRMREYGLGGDSGSGTLADVKRHVKQEIDKVLVSKQSEILEAIKNCIN